MRKILIAFLASFFSIGAVFAETTGGMTGSFVKADFKKEINSPKLHKLLGVGGGYLFLAKQDGSLDEVNEDGKTILTLAAKEGDHVLLKQPESVAVEGDTIYVVDSETNQVVMYTLSTGKYQGQFGAKTGGFFGGDGNELKSPRGIAVHDGVVYVADTGNNRIQLFGVNGVFLHTLALSAASSSEGTQEIPYRLKGNTGVALDSDGKIYVLNTGDNQVKYYSPNGRYIASLPDVGNPASLSVAEDGVYIADNTASTISKYDFDGKLAYTFGSKGEGKSQFRQIAGIAVDKGQLVYIGDNEKSLVNEFLTVAGTKLETIPKPAGRVSMKWLGSMSAEVTRMAGNGKGAIYAVSKDGKSLMKFQDGVAAGEIKPADMEITAVTVDSKGAIWVLDNNKKQGDKIDETGKVLVSFGSAGSGAGQFNSLTAIAVALSGYVYVADSGNRTIQVFRGDGVIAGNLSSNTANISNPIAMAFDTRDNLYVLDSGRGSVSVYSAANGNFIQEFGKLKEGSIFSKPLDLAVSADEVVVLDGNQVKTLTQKGELLPLFGAKETGVGTLHDPVALATSGGSTLLVADRSEKRVESFAVLYKPMQLEHVAAKGNVHAIELNWSQPSLPYIKTFRVYRSKTENGGFVQIATTTTNSYADSGLDAGAHYYYRIAAVSDFAYEGATSIAVNATSEKYVPHPLSAIKVETTPWQVKLSWNPVPAQYFAAYRVYQKEKDAFVKVGEVTQPEFIKDALTPETKYTYYVSVLSSDGTESEKLPADATTLVFNRPPLDIEVVKLQNIFSNSYKIYERDGVGVIKLTNNTDKPMDKIKVSFVLKNFMDYSTEGKIDRLMPGESQEMVLKAVFNNSILNITEDSSVQAMIEASYFDSGKRVTYSKNPTVTVYDKHRLSWNEHERYAVFVTPKDPPIMNLARAVAENFKETKDETQLAAAVFDAIGVYGVTYIPNPSNPYQESSGKVETVDYVQFPRETMDRKTGDCVDMVALYSSSLESMGINTLALEVPGHLLMMFSTGIAADEDGYTMDNMYVIYKGVLWIPVETTLLGNSFIKAWENGSATYYKYKDNGLTVLDVRSAWETYKPASLPDSNWTMSGLTRADIEKKFPSDHLSVLKISSQTKTRRYLAAIQKDPSDVNAHLQMGIILAKLGDRTEAMKYFDKVLSLDAKNAAAMNNRGNLLMIEDKYQDALKAYLAASKASPKDAQIWVNLARAYKRIGETKKGKAAFIKAQGLDSKVKEQYRALALELLNSI